MSDRQLYTRLQGEIDILVNEKRLNVIKELQSPQGPIIRVNNMDYVNMCSNNYLGWAADPITVKAAKEGIDKYGVGPGAVRSIAGTYDVHGEFERALAKFKGVEATIVVQSGFQANTALLPAISTADDLFITDSLNHASIIDGIRLSKAEKVIYQHVDMADLEEKLKNANVKGNKFIVTDGVFSMDGDVAPLDKIYELAKKYDAYIIVDDAHGEGVLGKGGRGAVSHFHLEGKIDIEIGTLSKAFGIVGGFIGGKKVLIDFLRQKARPFLFSSSVEPHICHAGLAIVNEMTKSDERVLNLWKNAKYLQSRFTNDGYSIGNTTTPITPFMVQEEAIATELTKRLFAKNILVSPIIYPTVAKGKARIRIMVSAKHTQEQIDKAYETIISEYKEIVK